MCEKTKYSKEVSMEVLEDFLRFMDGDTKLHFRALIAPKVRLYIAAKYKTITYKSQINGNTNRSTISR